MFTKDEFLALMTQFDDSKASFDSCKLFQLDSPLYKISQDIGNQKHLSLLYEEYVNEEKKYTDDIIPGSVLPFEQSPHEQIATLKSGQELREMMIVYYQNSHLIDELQAHRLVSILNKVEAMEKYLETKQRELTNTLNETNNVIDSCVNQIARVLLHHRRLVPKDADDETTRLRILALENCLGVLLEHSKALKTIEIEQGSMWTSSSNLEHLLYFFESTQLSVEQWVLLIKKETADQVKFRRQCTSALKALRQFSKSQNQCSPFLKAGKNLVQDMKLIGKHVAARIGQQLQLAKEFQEEMKTDILKRALALKKLAEISNKVEAVDDHLITVRVVAEKLKVKEKDIFENEAWFKNH